jgi:hypothetical protein
MPSEFPHIIPALPPEVDILETHQTAYEFYREVRYREEFERYCQWYEMTAQQHRQELHKMRGDFNLFGWFSRRRK